MGKLKTACLMVGIVLTLFYNLPFELFNLRVSDALLIVACVLSVISGICRRIKRFCYNSWRNRYSGVARLKMYSFWTNQLERCY